MPTPANGLYGLVLNSIAMVMLIIIMLALACIILGAIGQRHARRTGRQCPHCDYRGDMTEVLIHDALDHHREQA